MSLRLYALLPCLLGGALGGPVADMLQVGVKDPLHMIRESIDNPSPDLLEGLLEDPESLITVAMLNGFSEINYWGFPGYSPIMYACWREGSRPEHLRAMIAAGANPDLPNPNRITPLMVSCAQNDWRAVRVLLKAGVNPRKRNRLGMSAATLAARSGLKDVLRVLYDHGGAATLSLTEYDEFAHEPLAGWTPLHYAVKGSHVDLVRFIIFEVGWGSVKLAELIDIHPAGAEELKKLWETDSDWFKQQQKHHLENVVKLPTEGVPAIAAPKEGSASCERENDAVPSSCTSSSSSITSKPDTRSG